jgi:4a-hydroxytetrahydrobiopterin dehydratase
MWQEINNSLYQKFTFTNFVEAFGFITQVALLAEQQNHHPTIKNTWNMVEIWLQTHDAENTVTAKDKTLASLITGITTK